MKSIQGTLKRSRIVLALLIGVTLSSSLWSVPVTFQYQGHILVDGQAAEGSGNFKFSFLSGGGTLNEAVVWSNDNPEGTPGEPSASVALNLQRGVYSVSLGDTSIPNMAAISPEIFSGDLLSLRVWFSSEVQGPFVQLTPDTKVGSVGFAMRAATVERVEEEALPEAVGRLITLVDKMTFSSTSPSDSDLIDGGYSVFRQLDAADWEDGPDGAPVARMDHTGVWTGREFVVWGGATSGSSILGTGASFDSLSNTWKSVSAIDAPMARRVHGAVWTGERMMVWGGHDGNAWNPVGGMYDPRVQRWFPVPRSPILAREDHVMLWTGNGVLIWGGRHGQGRRGDGAVFNPGNNQWVSVPPQGAPVARSNSSAVWTGQQAIIWGGRTTREEVGDGSRLDIPAQGPMRWQPVSRADAPPPRQGHTAVWTGEKMIVWGGDAGGELLDTGGIYDPNTDSWSRVSRIDAPSARTEHSAVWTGAEMVILFGRDVNGETGTAHAYDPATDLWRALPSGGNSVARSGAAAAWTGSEIIVFGGEGNAQPVGALQRLNPEPPIFLYRKP